MNPSVPSSAPGLTVAQLTAGIDRALSQYGFVTVGVDLPDEWPKASEFRLYEDSVSIVALAAFTDWPSLSRQWTSAQEILDQLVGQTVASFDPKTWDSYLVLVVSQQLTDSDRAEAAAIRYDTRRARKIVVTGDEVRTIDGLELALMPVRPVVVPQRGDAHDDPLRELLNHIQGSGYDATSVAILVDAYRAGRLLLEELHDRLGGRT